MERREFLKLTGAGVAGSTLFSGLATSTATLSL
ncbi:MAG: twin-arginine translocation signal domain-containing protein [Gammaproteobacteria bacterium]|nr:twin-arginine translocation signal domain-containing protein [Gammaproteobacteria bacterium]